MFCLKILMDEALRRKYSKSFHSAIAAGKKEFSNNLCFTFIIEISETFVNGSLPGVFVGVQLKDTTEIGLHSFFEIKLIF